MLIGHVVSKLPRLPRLCSKAQWCTRPHMEILLWSGSTASDHGYEHLSHEAMKMIFCLLTKCPTMQTAQLTHRLPPPWAMVTQNCVSWKIRRYSTGTVCKYSTYKYITHIYIYIHVLLYCCPYVTTVFRFLFNQTESLTDLLYPCKHEEGFSQALQNCSRLGTLLSSLPYVKTSTTLLLNNLFRAKAKDCTIKCGGAHLKSIGFTFKVGAIDAPWHHFMEDLGMIYHIHA